MIPKKDMSDMKIFGAYVRKDRPITDACYRRMHLNNLMHDPPFPPHGFFLPWYQF